jgi:hypothetical protein
MPFEVDPKNVIMVTLEEIPEEQCRHLRHTEKPLKSIGRMRRRVSSRSFSPASRRGDKARSPNSRRQFSLLPVAKLS